jgi:hypothetical protein
MTTIELKKAIIQRISEINDVSFLKAIKTILDSKKDSEVIVLTQEQRDEIIKSNKEIENGLYIEGEVLNKEVLQWLNANNTEIEISPFVKSMASGVHMSADLDYKKGYSNHLREKYK